MAEVAIVAATEALTHVAVRGKLDAAGVGEVDMQLTFEIVSRGKPAIVDLSRVTVIASIGIGMLVAIARSMSSKHLGFAVVVGESPVQGMLEMARVSMICTVVTTPEEALRALGLG